MTRREAAAGDGWDEKDQAWQTVEEAREAWVRAGMICSLLPTPERFALKTKAAADVEALLLRFEAAWCPQDAETRPLLALLEHACRAALFAQLSDLVEDTKEEDRAEAAYETARRAFLARLGKEAS